MRKLVRLTLNAFKFQIVTNMLDAAGQLQSRMGLTYISNDIEHEHDRPGQSCNAWLYNIDLIHGTIVRTVINEDMYFTLSIYRAKFQDACSDNN